MKTLLFIASILMVLCPQCFSQDAWDKVEIIPHNITPSIKMLEGSGGNIGVVIGEKEILVIDAQFEPLYNKIQTTIGEISDLPVRYLINTHWHGDHTGGNNRFKNDGALLIAQDNVKIRMSNPQKIEHFGKEVAASQKESQPDITFKEELTIDLGNESLNFIHIKNAHTDGDVIIHSPKNNVIHMGDTYFEGKFPFIDVSSGGSVQGIINACEMVLKLSNDSTIIIPGHGSLSNKLELTSYSNMLIDLLQKVEKAKLEGLDLKTIVSKEFTSSYEEKFGGGFIQSKDIITFIFKSL